MTHETKMEIKRDYYAKVREKLYTYLETGTVQ